MGNDVALKATSPPVKLRLPAFLVAILDREPAPDIGWQPPDDAWVERHEQVLRKALAQIQAALQPASESFIREKLAVLATYKGSRAGVPAEWTLRRQEYIRLLGQYPADIWQDALDELALGSRWFPDVSEVNDLMHPKLSERRQHAERLEAMLRSKVENQPAVRAVLPAAVAVWRDNQARLEALATWPVLERCIPDSDNGETLTLAVEAPGLGFAVLAWAARDAQIILGRRITCIVRNWVQPALFERKVQIGGAPSTELHRRDGEIVKLDDSGWQVWRAGVGMLEGLPCEAAVRCCLPDDLDGQGLVLAVPGFKEACAVMDHPDELAKAFGVPVRKVFMSWIDAASKVRPDIKEAAA